jgi:hypothetical protein
MDNQTAQRIAERIVEELESDEILLYPGDEDVVLADLAAAIAPLVEALEEIRALPRDREDESRLIAGRALWEVQR